MQAALANVEGVEGVQVNFAAKTVEVTGADADHAALVAALEKAGFGGSVKK